MLIRENIFLEINAILNGHDYNKAYFYFFNEDFLAMGITRLVRLKWGLAGAFILLVSGMSVSVVNLWYNKPAYTKLMIYCYLGLFCFIALVLGITKLLNVFDAFYFVFRKLVGLAHSPIPLFLFFSMYYYIESKDKNV